jgi:hypothetical protein
MLEETAITSGEAFCHNMVLVSPACPSQTASWRSTGPCSSRSSRLCYTPPLAQQHSPHIHSTGIKPAHKYIKAGRHLTHLQ